MSRDSESPSRRFPELEAEYELVRELGRGGTAVVYLARERELGREVAVKLIRPAYANDAEAVARLAREARVVARLRHPNLVTLFGTRRLGNEGLALIMQYVPGRTLKALIREHGPLPVPLAERVLHDIGLALDYAHGQHGIVHRDIKPENIYIDDEYGTALLADFGIARAGDPDSSLTLAGTALGTPAYMSPEQIDGAELDGRSDLYSLGLVAHEMLTGRRPWEGHNLYTTIYKQKNEELPPITSYRSDVPRRLLSAIEGLLHKERADRWAAAGQFVRQLGSDAAPPARVGAAGSASPWTVQAAPAAGIEDARTIRYRRAEVVSGVADPDVEGGDAADDGDDLLLVDPAAAGADGWAVVSSAGAGAATPGEPRGRRGRMALVLLALVVGASAAMLAMLRADGDAPSGGAVASVEGAAPPAPAPLPAEPPAQPEPAAAGGPPARLVLLGPEDAAAPAGEPLPGPVMVRIEDPAGDPVAGVRVEFRVVEGDGEVFPDATLTDSAGLASVVWALGRAAGDHRLDVQVDGANGLVATVRATAAARDPARLVVEGGQDQEAAAGDAPLPEPVSVRVEDEYGNPVDGARVEFRVAERSGSVDPVVATTASDGVARATWTPGRDAGDHELVAVVPGITALEARFRARVRLRLSPRPAIVAGAAHTCAVLPNGRAHCWGGNENGQLGVGDADRRAGPVPVTGGLRFAAVATGGGHTCGLDLEGAAYCWGQNDHGQLGDGSRASRRSPIRVLASTPLVSIAAGLSHTCATDERDRVHCWGANDNGQLGDGARGERSLPAPVLAQHAFRAVSVGWSHTCGLTRGGVALCWGSNESGQLGDGGTVDRPAPAAVAANTRFAELSAGATHTCGLTAAGEVYCWGRNHQGQLGDGTTTDRSRPVRVADLDRATAVTSGAVHSCALTRDGAAWCWGSNAFGQLGDGTTTGSSAPVRVAAEVRFVTLDASGSHTCGRSAGGESYCWGFNVEGQLGDGTRANRSRPVRIAAPW